MKEQYPKMATIFPEIFDKTYGSPSVRILRQNHVYITKVDTIANEVMIVDNKRVYVIDLDITYFERYLRRKDILVKSITDKGTWYGQPDTITYDSPISYSEWLINITGYMDKSDEYFSELVADFFTHIGKERLDEELQRALSNELKDL